MGEWTLEEALDEMRRLGDKVVDLEQHADRLAEALDNIANSDTEDGDLGFFIDKLQRIAREARAAHDIRRDSSRDARRGTT